MAIRPYHSEKEFRIGVNPLQGKLSELLFHRNFLFDI